jgi:hypothetical protein
MGWEVIALGSIEFVNGASPKKIIYFINKLNEMEQVINVDKHGLSFVNVQMSGNKGIDYENLTALCNECADIIDAETISFGEYCETGDGFYWERADEL